MELIVPTVSAHRYTQVQPSRSAVIPAGMQESSAMDGNLSLSKCLIQAIYQPADSPPCDWIPAVHAGMTGFNHLCITMSAAAWERSMCATLGGVARALRMRLFALRVTLLARIGCADEGGALIDSRE